MADNTLIEMNGACTGLLTTQGFRDELELRRGFKEDIWDVRLPPPTPIIPRRRRLGVPERIRFDGSVHTPLDEDAARAAIRRLAKQGVESVAICTLFSFVNPAHELRLAEIVAEEMPDAYISLSHQVLPKSPEFDRTSTTVVNAYVGPRVSQYLDRLSERLQESGYQHQLMVMQSNGGVMTREYLAAQPDSRAGLRPGRRRDRQRRDRRGEGRDGPAVRRHGRHQLRRVRDSQWHGAGAVRLEHAPPLPGGVPMVQVETLGAGGGSICSATSGTLQVGPASAGAAPGPICYGRGGTLPTVTDAILMLGLLSDESDFAGGSFRLIAQRRRGSLAGACRRPDELQRRGGRVRLLARGQCQHDAGRAAPHRGKGQQSRRTSRCSPTAATARCSRRSRPRIWASQRVLVPRTSPGFSATGALAAQPCIDEERSYIVAGDPGRHQPAAPVVGRTGPARRALSAGSRIYPGRTSTAATSSTCATRDRTGR